MDHPISRTKITPAPYREATLARDRLVDRLRENVHGRLTLVVADAGYGKTTLLADFSRRQHVRCLWYKLDPSDRDWVTFTSYLVAAGREAKADFGKSTTVLLGQLAAGNPARDHVVESLVADFALLQDQPTALILDDYHLIDDSPDVRFVMTRLLRDAPEALNVILCTRRRPDLPIGRLAARGEVHEIDTDDLRFSRDETDQLFSHVYRQPLEQDVIEEIEQRTEGWAASLQLLHSSIRERTKSEIRAFVRQLSGAEGRLYDFLAEEVLRELPPVMARFLVHASLLERIVPSYVAAIFATDPERPTLATVEGLIAEAALLGFMAKRGEQSRSHRFHPLLRDFLQGQLSQQESPAAIRAMHGRIARAAEKDDWLTSARHYVAAGESTEAVRVLEASAHVALGTGEWEAVAEVVAGLSHHQAEPAISATLARRDVYEGQIDRGVARLDAIDINGVDGVVRSLVRHVRGYVAWYDGDPDEMMRWVDAQITDTDTPRLFHDIAEAQQLLMRAAAGRSLSLVARRIADLGRQQAMDGLHYFAAVSYHNVMWLELCRADYRRALDFGHRSLREFDETVVSPRERQDTFALMGLAALELGDIDESEKYLAAASGGPEDQPDALSLCALARVATGHLDSARDLLDRALNAVAAREPDANARMLLGRAQRAYDLAGGVAPEPKLLAQALPPIDVGARLAEALGAISIAVLTRSSAMPDVDALRELVKRQGALHWEVRLEMVLAAASGNRASLDHWLRRAERTGSLAMLEHAEILSRFANVPPPDHGALIASIRRWPNRWLPLLRREIASGNTPSAIACARLLDELGELDDVPRLRAFEKTYLRGKGLSLGRALARRKSPPLTVSDLGRVQLTVGDRQVPLSGMRRKAASLLLFLATRPNLTATREQVLEELWPQLDPSAASNSLNQTLYFLRRDIDPWYDDDVSFNYLRNEGELVWLDSTMVTIESRDYLDEAQALSSQPVVARVKLVYRYEGRFAPEFEYEEWAIGWRERLHAVFLHLVETTEAELIGLEKFDEALRLAQHVLHVDPDAIELERTLVWLYSATGSRAAANEQYSHYAAAHREQLGAEPPSLGDILATAPGSRSSPSATRN